MNLCDVTADELYAKSSFLSNFFYRWQKMFILTNLTNSINSTIFTVTIQLNMYLVFSRRLVSHRMRVKQAASAIKRHNSNISRAKPGALHRLSGTSNMQCIQRNNKQIKRDLQAQKQPSMTFLSLSLYVLLPEISISTINQKFCWFLR